jgi:hypothetical protein
MVRNFLKFPIPCLKLDYFSDFEAKTAPPRWRVSLEENPIVEPTWEIVTVATSSINLVVNRVEKVGFLARSQWLN